MRVFSLTARAHQWLVVGVLLQIGTDWARFWGLNSQLRAPGIREKQCVGGRYGPQPCFGDGIGPVDDDFGVIGDYGSGLCGGFGAGRPPCFGVLSTRTPFFQLGASSQPSRV